MSRHGSELPSRRRSLEEERPVSGRVRAVRAHRSPLAGVLSAEMVLPMSDRSARHRFGGHPSRLGASARQQQYARAVSPTAAAIASPGVSTSHSRSSPGHQMNAAPKSCLAAPDADGATTRDCSTGSCKGTPPRHAQTSAGPHRSREKTQCLVAVSGEGDRSTLVESRMPGRLCAGARRQRVGGVCRSHKTLRSGPSPCPCPQIVANQVALLGHDALAA